MFPLNWNIPFIRKNGSRTTLGAITGDIAGIEEDVAELTEKTDGLFDNMLENGAVNYCNFNAATETQKGYTFTNTNGVVHVTGSRTEGQTGNVDFNKTISLKAGTYKLTGCPSGGSANTWRLLLDINNGAKYVFDYGDGAEFTLDADSNNVRVYCTIMSAYSGSVDMYFKPMISDPSLNLSYNDFVPYAMTNRELTQSVSALSSEKLSILKENNPTWHHTASVTCDLNSGGLAYLFTNVGLVLLNTSSNSIGMRTGLALQSDTNTYFKAEITGLSGDITAWQDDTFETSKNAIWTLVPICGTWTITF